MATQDFEYEGYHFKSGTVFTINAWAIALDDREYKDAEKFEPDRFMDNEVMQPLLGHWGFGAGRRVCIGWSVGAQNLFIELARIIYCFNVEQIPGHEIDTHRIPPLAHDSAPFQVKITPRSPAHAALIERECKSALTASLV